MNKRIAAIHDLSGFGKCSLTIILPILSACGLEACPLPTAFLSSHTGGLPGFTHRDLTSDLLPAARQWSELKLRFDGIYSGFLGSLEQIFKVSEIFDLLSGRDTLIFVDPCMEDNGKLYQTYSSDMARSTQLLCHKADFILPNLTEACLLLNEPYRPERYRTREAVARLTQDLAARFQCGVVLTGIGFSPEQTGAAFCVFSKSCQTLSRYRRPVRQCLCGRQNERPGNRPLRSNCRRFCQRHHCPYRPRWHG